jgi:hypothetical protein
LPLEAWQALDQVVLPDLVHIFQQAAVDAYPDDWKTASLVWLKKPQKATRKPEGFRDICLMTALAQANSRTIVNRIQPEVLRGILPTQFGFLPRLSTLDAITISRDIQARMSKMGQSLVIASIGLRQAFYKLRHEQILESLGERLFHEGLVAASETL